jgi:hypothetical protein
MKFYNNRKPIEVTSDYQINGTQLDVKKKWLSPCTLTLAHSTVVLLLNTPYNGKSVLFLERDWTVQASDKEDDFELVTTHNKEIQNHFENLDVLEEGIDAAVGASMSTVYISEDYWVAPSCKWLLDMSKVDAVFFERMCSYTRTFDIVFCGGNNTLDTLNSVSRKKDHGKVMELLTKSCAVYSTGPDPLDWKDLIRFKKNQHTWKEVADYANSQEDGSEESDEEWIQGQTDDELSDEISDGYTTDVLEESSDDDVNILDNEDYEKYERQSKKARVD